MPTDNKSRNIRISLALLFIVVLSLGRLIYAYFYMKEDFHSDEIWSFGLANSYYEPFIYQTADHNELTNYKTWFSSQTMRDYLIVDKSHRFSYGSVYYNQVHDNHPPLYYFVLHTICSFFPGKFSPWYSFVINIFSYGGTIYLLFKLIKNISKSDVCSVMGCFFYSLSMGAFNTFIFSRMYALLTMISTMYLYYHSKLCHSDKDKKILVILFFITLMGSLTHHFFIPFAGYVSACFCIYYLIKKKYRVLFRYAFTMFFSVILSVAIFPATIDHVFSGRIDDVKYPLIWQIKMTLNCMTTELWGCITPVFMPVSPVAVLIIVVCTAIILAPLIFLFRNENWFRTFVSKLKSVLFDILDNVKDINVMMVSLIFSTLGTILLVAFTVSFIHMKFTTDRYIFITFPGAVTVFIILLNSVLNLIKKKTIKKVMFLFVCVFFCAASNIYSPNNYILKKNDSTISAENEIKDSNCIFVCDRYWLLTCFARVSMKSSNIYALTASNLKDDVNDIPEPPDSEKQLYYYIDNDSFLIDEEAIVFENNMPIVETMDKNNGDRITKLEFESLLKDKYSMCEYVGTDQLFGRIFSLYRVR